MHTQTHARALMACLLAAACAAAPALAEKPEGVGKGKPHKEAKAGKAEKAAGKPGKAGNPAQEVRAGAFFSDQHRHAARTYYTQRYAPGKACPPGLAKKNNGCMPPGLAKKWAVGQPLPAGVTVYPVPQAVLVQLPPVPVGYRYVRVAGDILLIALGTQMVVDGISDLLRL